MSFFFRPVDAFWKLKTDHYFIIYQFIVIFFSSRLLQSAIIILNQIESPLYVEIEYNKKKIARSLAGSTHFSMNRMSFVATVVCIKLAEIQFSFTKQGWCHQNIVKMQLNGNKRVLQLYTFYSKMKWNSIFRNTFHSTWMDPPTSLQVKWYKIGIGIEIYLTCAQ